MINIERLQQKKIGEMLDFLIDSIPQLKKDLQELGLTDLWKNDKNSWDLIKKHVNKSKDWQLKKIWEIIKKRLKKELNIII